MCGSADVKVLLDFGMMPLAGGFIFREEVGEDQAYPLRLARCAGCTLMQVPEVVDPNVIFRRYSYSSSTTRTLSEHFQRMAQDLVDLADAKGRLVVEFGCNDGVLIRPLRALGANAVGVDPSDVASKASKAQAWPLVPGYFNEETAGEVLRQFGKARVVTANNVFAHSDDLDAMMRGVARVLDAEGLFVFEVHYQGDLVKLVQFDTIYHEHLCYYSLASLARLMERFDFGILDVEPIPIHSGSIRVVAGRAGSARMAAPAVAAMLEAESRWDIPRFVQQVEARRSALRKLVSDLRAADRTVAAYGASGRATVLLNYCGFGPDQVAYVSDASPLRHGRLVPGVRVPIEPPTHFRRHPPDYCLLTAWNYEEEVKRNEAAYLEGGGLFIVPLPELRLAGAA